MLVVLGAAVLVVSTVVVGGLAQAAPSGPSSAVAGGRSSAANPSTSWANISGSVGNAPPERSISAAAYSPVLNATILFGGYNGVGGNFPLGDTWEFANNTWTELFPAVSPSPRWGATMVYDPTDQAIVLFGGRNATAFFNDTWEFNASGWHNVTTAVAPSPRYDYGMAYDSELGEVVLFGGGIGNNPAGTFTNFVFYNDTWTFQNGTWANITASAGVAPPGRLIRGQMAYDAADGYVVLTGGWSFVPLGSETSCGYVVFNQSWSGTWTFAGGVWSPTSPVSGSPPDGVGVVWFDTEANETLYYEGMWLGPSSACDVSGNQVWSYQAGNWTLVTEGNLSAPAPREQPVFVDDQGDHEQVEFGGELASTASEYYAAYLNDTWTYAPTWVTFQVHGTPAGSHWQVKLAGKVGKSSGHRMVFVEAPGAYQYRYALVRGARTLLSGEGKVALVRSPVAVGLSYPRKVPTYQVTFTEVGLSSGTWSVTVQGKTETEPAGTAIVFNLPNGTYAWKVGPEPGYKHLASAKSLKVRGSPTAVTITFEVVRPGR